MASLSRLAANLKINILFAQPVLYVVCGIVNILASFTYISFLYLLRYIDFTFSVKVAMLVGAVCFCSCNYNYYYNNYCHY
jgi:hypothetical protein